MGAFQSKPKEETKIEEIRIEEEVKPVEEEVKPVEEEVKTTRESDVSFSLPGTSNK